MKADGLKNIILLLMLSIISIPYGSAQPPIQKYWALNQCELLFGKYNTQLPSANIAYSVRKLYCSYTGYCMRVRISGGAYNGSVGDVSFYGGMVVSPNSNVTVVSGTGSGTTVIFSTFYAGTSTNAYVVTWYDQSGKGNNATQATITYQPQIVSNGTLLTENGFPTIQFTGAHTSMYLGLTTSLSLPNGSLFGVCRVVSPSTTCGIADNGTYSYNLNTYNNTKKIGITQYGNVDAYSNLYYNTTSLDVVSWSKASSNNYVETNNRTASSTANINATLNIPIAISQVYGNALSDTQLHISEFIVTGYASTSQRSVVFNNQHFFFNTP